MSGVLTKSRCQVFSLIHIHTRVQTRKMITEKMDMSISLTVVVIISLSVHQSSVHPKYIHVLTTKVNRMYYILIMKQISIHIIMMYVIC